MRNELTKTRCYQLQLRQQGSAAIAAAIAVLMIAGIYFLFGLWGWSVIVGVLVVISAAGLAMLEVSARRQQGADSTDQQNQAVRSEAAVGTASKTTHRGAINVDKAADRHDISGESVKQYRLELVNPGKEPVQVMRLLHNDFGFTADMAKQKILNLELPLALAQGEKPNMQERAKSLLKAGAKLRLVACQSDNPSATHINQPHAI